MGSNVLYIPLVCQASVTLFVIIQDYGSGTIVMRVARLLGRGNMIDCQRIGLSHGIGSSARGGAMVVIGDAHRVDAGTKVGNGVSVSAFGNGRNISCPFLYTDSKRSCAATNSKLERAILIAITRGRGDVAALCKGERFRHVECEGILRELLIAGTVFGLTLEHVGARRIGVCGRDCIGSSSCESRNRSIIAIPLIGNIVVAAGSSRLIADGNGRDCLTSGISGGTILDSARVEWRIQSDHMRS